MSRRLGFANVYPDSHMDVQWSSLSDERSAGDWKAAIARSKRRESDTIERQVVGWRSPWAATYHPTRACLVLVRSIEEPPQAARPLAVDAADLQAQHLQQCVTCGNPHPGE